MDFIIFWIINIIIGISIALLYLVFGVPWWAIAFVVMPLAIIIMVIYSSMYNFRPGLKVEPIPPGKFNDRRHALEQDANEIRNLGFEKVDEFFLKMIPDCVTFTFKHKEDPIYIYVYHLGQKKMCDVITFFENGFSITTSSSLDGGNVPMGQKGFLQILDNGSYSKLLEMHRESIHFLEEKGLKTRSVPTGSYREELLKSVRETGKRIKSYTFWPVLLLVWVLTTRGKKHARSIEEQFRAGFISISNP